MCTHTHIHTHTGAAIGFKNKYIMKSAKCAYFEKGISLSRILSKFRIFFTIKFTIYNSILQ